MVLVNGMVIAVVSRTMSAPLRSPALYWCAGTLLLALSGAAFGLGTILPRAFMIVIANGAIALGFTSYHFAIRRFTGSPLKPVLLLPPAIVISTVIVFQAVIPSFQVRVTVVSILWAWQMAMCANELWSRTRTEPSLAANILTGLFALGPVDKVDSQISKSVIQDCLLGGGFGSRRPDGYGMADH